jgi:hypothetical protein
MTYGMEFVWANTLATLFIALGKVFIVILNVFTLLCFMRYRGDLEEVKSIGGPVLMTILASWTTANLFMGMMDETVLAMLTCLCIDRGINDGEAQRGPPTFHDAVQKIPSERTEKGSSKDKY